MIRCLLPPLPLHLRSVPQELGYCLNCHYLILFGILDGQTVAGHSINLVSYCHPFANWYN